MKHIAIKGGKRFFTGALMAGLFLFVPSVFNFFFDATSRIYYEHAPVSAFLQHRGITFEDMCYGDLDHLAVSTREVQSEYGYRANISRELYQLQSGGVFAKIYEQDGVDVIVEYTDEPAIYRVQSYDEPLEEGKYYWQIRINELEVQHGIIRYDIPALKSNVFEVLKCDGKLYDRIER